MAGDSAGEEMATADFAQGSTGDLRILLLGRSGSGKSSSGNTILGEKVFISPKRYKEKVTKTCEEQIRHVAGRKVCVIDTPDLLDPDVTEDELKREKDKLVSLCQSGLHAVLLVVPVGEELQNEEEMLEFIKELFSPDIQKFIIVLFTRGDELEEDETIEQHIQEQGEELKQLIERCCGHFHVFNNKQLVEDQVTELLDKIENSVKNNVGTFVMGQRRRNSMDWGTYFPETTPLHPEEDRRIVLVGKTGVGKSASGNTILGKKRFRSEFGSSSVTSMSEMQQDVVLRRTVSMIDTPGFFDTQLSREELSEEIGRSVYLSSPGPHALLYILPVNSRFTEQEENVIEKLELIFGREMKRYTIILFTYGDQLEGKSVDTLIQQNRSLSRLVAQCGGRYHIFNNKDLRNRKQVSELLQKIDRMVEENGGTCYTNEMYEEAARIRRDEEEEMKIREETERLRQEEKEKMSEETERLRRELEERMIENKSREEEEKGFKGFFKRFKYFLLTAGGVAFGSGALSGTVAGAVVGGAVGGPAGAGIGSGISNVPRKLVEKYKQKKQSTQRESAPENAPVESGIESPDLELMFLEENSSETSHLIPNSNVRHRLTWSRFQNQD